LPITRTPPFSSVLLDEMKAIAKRRKLKVVCYAPSTVKKYICGNGRVGEKEMARVIVAKYPEPKVYLTQDRAWKEKYHQNMFDAVALGMMAMKHEKAW
jgi:Holliday junction resolvasome RuvABC endonuclease subunit